MEENIDDDNLSCGLSDIYYDESPSPTSPACRGCSRLTHKGTFKKFGLPKKGFYCPHCKYIEEHLNTEYTYAENYKIQTGAKDDSEKLPLGIVIQRQFPNALKALASTSQYGHNKYKETDQDWKNCFRVQDGEERYLNAGMRHLLDAGDKFDGVDESGLPHIRHVVWNFMVLLEILETKVKES